MSYPQTPDGRYFVVKQRLWRLSNPKLDPDERQRLVDSLMQARRAIKQAKLTGDAHALNQARQQVQHTKVALGERGPVWWHDGAQDFNRYLVHNTPYKDWFERLSAQD